RTGLPGSVAGRSLTAYRLTNKKAADLESAAFFTPGNKDSGGAHGDTRQRIDKPLVMAALIGQAAFNRLTCRWRQLLMVKSPLVRGVSVFLIGTHGAQDGFVAEQISQHDLAF